MKGRCEMESIIEALREVMKDTSNVDSISINYCRQGAKEQCNMCIVTKDSNNKDK